MRYIILLLCFVAIGCYEDKVAPICTDCDAICPISVEIDEDSYDNAVSHPIEITDAYMEDDCLTVVFDFTGCGESLELKLYDQGVVAESFPVQRNIRVVLGDASGNCTTSYTKSPSFNMEDTRTQFFGPIAFNLEGWDEPIIYTDEE
ncbi:MAG: hypothetical protein ABJN36_19650 [Cyclobacteriaceae bacterium]